MEIFGYRGAFIVVSRLILFSARLSLMLRGDVVWELYPPRNHASKHLRSEEMEFETLSTGKPYKYRRGIP